MTQAAILACVALTLLVWGIGFVAGRRAPAAPSIEPTTLTEQQAQEPDAAFVAKPVAKPKKGPKKDQWGFIEKPRYWINHSVYNDGSERWYLYERNDAHSLGALILSVHDSEEAAKRAMNRERDRERVSWEVVATVD